MPKPDVPGFFPRDGIGPESAAYYKDQGYLVIHDAVSPAEVEVLRREAVAVCRGQRGALATSYREHTQAVSLPSEQEQASLSDDEIISRYLCIHHPHKTSPVIRRYLAHPAIVEVLTGVIGPNVKCMQSMLFIKSAGRPGQAWHQDEDYIPTRDRSLAGAWIALDEATTDNGCLWVIPGSQQPGILWPQYPHDDPRYDCAQMAYDFPYAEADAVPVEVPAGAIVFFNGYLLHKSEPNRRKVGFRRVLVNHYMSAESLLPWHTLDAGKGPVAQADYRDIVLVAGEDPYAWKGTEDLARPHVRPAGDGGCGDGRVDLATHKENLQTQSAESGKV